MSASCPLPKRFVNLEIHSRECFDDVCIGSNFAHPGNARMKYLIWRKPLADLVTLDFGAYFVAETLHRILLMVYSESFPFDLYPRDVEAKEIETLH